MSDSATQEKDAIYRFIRKLCIEDIYTSPNASIMRLINLLETELVSD